MPIIVRRGPRRPVANAVVTGAVVGGAMARNANRRQAQAQQQAKMQREISEANAKAEKAQKEAEQARLTAKQSSEASMVKVQVQIPYGVVSGQTFQIDYNGQNFQVVCPQNLTGGQNMVVKVPAVATASATTAPVVAAVPAAPAPVPVPASEAAVVTAPPATAPTFGKDLFLEATAAQEQGQRLTTIKDHLVDESNPTMKQFGIISVPSGQTLILKEGTLENGLGESFKDYIRVLVPGMGGKTGLISRHVAKPEEVSAPPPAIGSAPAPGPPPAIL